jgi:endonuclease YncB( thermonuclease family)
VTPDRPDPPDQPDQPDSRDHSEHREPPPTLYSRRRSRTRPGRPRGQIRPNASLERRRAALNRWTLIFGVLVGVSALATALLARNGGSDPPSGVGPIAPADAVAVEVVDIVDGDTLHVRSADGAVLTVRLFGVDTPERGEDCYAEATNRLRDLAGDAVLLLADVRLQDQGGRELRYVFTEDRVSIDAALLDEGLAVAWTSDGTFRDEFVALEEGARAAGTGCLWAG